MRCLLLSQTSLSAIINQTPVSMSSPFSAKRGTLTGIANSLCSAIADMRYTHSSGVASRLVAGGLWLLLLGAAVDGESGIGMAALWTLPAAVTWYVLVTNAAAHPPRKPHGGVWWLLSLGGPLSLVLLAFVARGDAEPAPAPRH